MIWLAAASAQEAPAPAAEDQAPIEITVWGDLAVDQARDAVVRQVEALGYRVVRRQDGQTRFRPLRRWKGSVTFHDDGTFTYGRPVAGFASMPPEIYTTDPRYQSLDPNDPTLVGIGPSFWLLPSKQKLEASRVEVLDQTRDEVEAYLAIKRRTAFEQSLLELPERLDRLWSEGEPLEPGPTLSSFEARRRAALELWATRADSIEGDRTTEAVEGWLRAVVESGPHPITPEERAEFAARRPGRPLP